MKKPALRFTVAIVCALLAGCSGDGNEDVSRTEQETAKAYVAALNARDADALAKLGSPGYEGAKTDAEEIIATDGGRDLKVKSVQVSHDVGPDVASAQVVATDKQGKPFSTHIQMSREKDVWVVALGQAPGIGNDGKSPASTKPPR